MTNILTFLVVIAVLGAIVVLVGSRVRADTVKKRESAGRVFRDSETGKLLDAFLAEIREEDADGTTANLSRLREVPKRVFEEIEFAYGTLPVSDYRVRWAIVHLATMLESAWALPFLGKIIEAEIPTDAPRAPHRFSTVKAELTIRIRAVEGLRRLAIAGEREARAQMLRHVSSPHFSIRKAAALGLLGLDDGDAYREQIAALLPAHEQFVFDIKEGKVEEAGVIRRAMAGAPSASPAPDLAHEGASAPEGKRDRRGPPTLRA